LLPWQKLLLLYVNLTIITKFAEITMHALASYFSFIVLLLGLGLMLAEAMLFSYGLLGISGLLIFVLGVISLVQNGVISSEIAWAVGIGAAVSNLAFLLLVLYLALRSKSKKVVIGAASLLGQIAVVEEGLDQGRVWVKLAGERWQACAKELLLPGQRVEVIKVSGLTLWVKPIQP
jgi:membrane-bound serine protease (ClpP class)